MNKYLLIFSLLLPLLGSGQAYTLDTTFRLNGHMRATTAIHQCHPGFIYWLASLPGGRVMAHGLFEYAPYPPTAFSLTGDLAIFHQDGRLDTSFRHPGTKAGDAMRYSDGLVVRDSCFYVNHWRYGYGSPTWGDIPINRFDLSTGNHLGGSCWIRA